MLAGLAALVWWRPPATPPAPAPRPEPIAEPVVEAPPAPAPPPPPPPPAPAAAAPPDLRWGTWADEASPVFPDGGPAWAWRFGGARRVGPVSPRSTLPVVELAAPPAWCQLTAAVAVGAASAAGDPAYNRALSACRAHVLGAVAARWSAQCPSGGPAVWTLDLGAHAGGPDEARQRAGWVFAITSPAWAAPPADPDAVLAAVRGQGGIAPWIEPTAYGAAVAAPYAPDPARDAACAALGAR